MGEPTPTSSSPRHKRDSGMPFDTRMTLEETKYLTKLLTDLAAWDPTQNVTLREKRFVPLFASLGAAIGSIVNAGQIKKIKKNIAILQEATLLAGPANQGVGQICRSNCSPYKDHMILKFTGSSINYLWLRME